MFAFVQWQDGEGHSERGGCDHVWDRDGKMERGEKGTASVVAVIACGCDRDGCDRVWLRSR